MKTTALTLIFAALFTAICHSQMPDLTDESSYSVSKSTAKDPYLVKISHKNGVFIAKAWHLPVNKQKELGFDPIATKKVGYDQKLEDFRKQYMQDCADRSEVAIAFTQAGITAPPVRKLSAEEKEIYLQGRLLSQKKMKPNGPVCFSDKLTKYFETEAQMKAAEAAVAEK
jgi:hypothetical protein